MFRGKAAGVLSQTLDRIHQYCKSIDLPPLNALVVGLGKGIPGKSIPMDIEQVDVAREKVYAADWFDVCVPTKEQFDKMT